MIAAWAASLLLAAAVAGAVPAGPACQNDAAVEPPTRTGPARFTGSAAYSALRRSGREVVAEKTRDLDADGRPDALVVSRSDDGMELSAYRNALETGFELLSRSSPLAGDELHRFEAVDLGGRPGYLLDVIEDSPDEADHHLALFVANPAGLAQVLTTGWRQKHSEEEAGRQAEDVIDLGGVSPGISLESGSDGEWPIVEVYSDPKEVVFSGPERKPVRIVLGIRNRSFLYKGGRYREAIPGFLSFLQSIQGSTFPQSDTEVDPPQRSWKTATVPNGLDVALKRPASIRVVGLAHCKTAGEQVGKVRRFEIAFQGEQPMAIDLDDPGTLPREVAGVGTYMIPAHNDPMPDKEEIAVHVGLAKPAPKIYTLVFLREPVWAGELKLTVTGVEPEEGGFCLRAVTAFTAMVDRAKPTSSASSTPP